MSNFFYPFHPIVPFSQLQCGMASLEQRWQKVLGITELPNNINFKEIPIITGPLDNGCYPFKTIELVHAFQLSAYNQQIIASDLNWWKNEHTQLMEPPINCTIIGNNEILIEEGANIYPCMFNTEAGPIIISKNANILEGSILRGPLYVGEGATIKCGAIIYGATSLFNNCVAGGEVKNSILMWGSNKAHGGYLGDSVVGVWCNFGAGTEVSNLKNTCHDITAQWENEELMVGKKAGVVFGHFSRTAINSTINSGSVIGSFCHVFGAGFAPGFLPHFSWGYAGDGYEKNKAIEHAQNWGSLKNIDLSQAFNWKSIT
jgi:UDP-N-acetylglucosamine diphosphorylase / glucose-1-phosphate thymidylyltransferase / UDP-N-acetylgalactosamine diphosphorylase / glucosamine-1-phosphate N-acetyltransferase / galactosamine-1-phosphate N-acetyltransferase